MHAIETIEVHIGHATVHAYVTTDEKGWDNFSQTHVEQEKMSWRDFMARSNAQDMLKKYPPSKRVLKGEKIVWESARAELFRT
jgi:hypothetical protein